MKRWRAASASHVPARLRDALFRPQTAGTKAVLALLTVFDGHGELDLFLLRQQWLTGRCL